MTLRYEPFRSYIRKVGSGQNTSRALSREESANALKLILTGQATPAQIGAFMIAHRIRRPEPQELAGMLDTYLELGPKLKSNQNHRRPICFGMPFDGRTRTAPIYPLTSLILLSAGQPIILQGGNRMPIKYGVTPIELFKCLGLNMENLNIKKVQDGFDSHGLAIIHQPDHFPEAESLIEYRDQIGKRPPLATMELLWTAHEGEHLLISGFVHPPTEQKAWETAKIRGEKELITIKGLEGSNDLPTSRACIAAVSENNKPNKRLILHPTENGFYKKDIKWESLKIWNSQALEALENKGPLTKSIIWNAGVYLWLSKTTLDLQEGINKAKYFLESGEAKIMLQKLIKWREMQF